MLLKSEVRQRLLLVAKRCLIRLMMNIEMLSLKLLLSLHKIT